MERGRPKCVIILSNKSSGSTACQTFLSRFADVRHVATTRHFANETLYWTKAASVLNLPQHPMLDSEVPIGQSEARRDLVQLLRDNLDDYTPPADDTELIFDGWRRLCEAHAPVFLEKSPHHLFQWSALELIAECIRRLPQIDFCIIGLVRNPMDVLYSSYRRWKTPPELGQREWIEAYRNLRRLEELFGNKLVIVRYEDMVRDLTPLLPVFELLGVSVEAADQTFFHERSLARWKRNRFYGFQPSDELIELAETYGYTREELTNSAHLLWPVYRNVARGIFKASIPGRRVLHGVKRTLQRRGVLQS